MRRPAAGIFRRLRSQALWSLYLLGALTLAGAPRAQASSLTYDYTDCFINSGSGCLTAPPWGTVTVSSVSSTEVSVTLTLATGEVFAFGGAGLPLLFDISGNPSVTVSGLPSGFTFTHHPMTMADGAGKWDYFINCTTCGSGTSGMVSGPITFYVTLAGGITPASFIANNKGLFFASDIGIPVGGGNYNTGDVGALTAVPLPSSLVLIGGVLALLALAFRRPRPVAGAAGPALV